MDSDSSDEENCFRSKSYYLYQAYLAPIFGYRYAFLRLIRLRS